jgi:tRNA(Ile)-lysidine synthase
MSRKDTTVENGFSDAVPSGARLLIAVSGGIDSMVLLDACSKGKALKRIHIEVAHIDHSLRPDSVSDSEFVKSECGKLGIPFHLKKLSPPDNGNIEAWARNERYSFLGETRTRLGLDFILTAHNANDVAETLLMRLISGKELNSISEYEEQRKLIRPLLGVRRDAINDYASLNKVAFREDPTNKQEIYFRNRVRNSLIPLLQRDYEPRIVEILADTARHLQSDISCLNQIAERVSVRFPFKDGDKEWRRALKNELLSAEPGLRWRVIQRIMHPKLGFNLSREHCQRLFELISGDITGVELPGGISIRTHEGALKMD